VKNSQNASYIVPSIKNYQTPLCGFDLWMTKIITAWSLAVNCHLKMTQGCETHERTNILTDKRLKEKIDSKNGALITKLKCCS